MGFPVKASTNTSDKTVSLNFSGAPTRILDLHSVSVSFYKTHLTLCIIANGNGDVKETSAAHKIKQSFEQKNENYVGLFSLAANNAGTACDRYYLSTNGYELSEAQQNRLLCDFIDAISDAVNISINSLLEFHDGIYNFFPLKPEFEPTIDEMQTARQLTRNTSGTLFSAGYQSEEQQNISTPLISRAAP